MKTATTPEIEWTHPNGALAPEGWNLVYHVYNLDGDEFFPFAPSILSGITEAIDNPSFIAICDFMEDTIAAAGIPVIKNHRYHDKGHGREIGLELALAAPANDMLKVLRAIRNAIEEATAP